MKIIISLFLLSSVNVFAQTTACEKFAGKAVLGFVKGLNKDVSVENVKLVATTAKNEVASETYEVKLKGNGFSSVETNGVWTIKLWDLGDGCNFSSLALSDAQTPKEEFVDFSCKSDLQKLMQAINKVNDGSANGKSTDPATIACTMTTSDQFCTISK